MRISAAFALLALGVAAGVAGLAGAASSRCDTGLLQSVCPSSHPVCCFRRESQVWAACCAADSVCRLDEGVCITYPANSSARPNNTIQDVPDSDGLDVSLSLAAIIVAVTAVFMIVATAASIACGIWASLRYDLYRIRRDALAAAGGAAGAGASAASSSESPASNAGDDAGGDLPENTECILCYTYRKDTVLMPCGHMICCRTCAARLALRGVCPMCRQVVRSHVRISRGGGELAAAVTAGTPVVNVNASTAPASAPVLSPTA